jgi:hypothetical protein
MFLLMTSLRPAVHLVWRDFGETLIVMDWESGESHELNSTGAFVWRNLHLDIEEIAVCLARDYESPVEEIRLDVQGLLTSFREKRLLS